MALSKLRWPSIPRTAHWLERRVGSLGEGRSRILNDLGRELPEIDGSAVGVGLDDGAVNALAERHHFADLARHFPTRGASNRLGRVARFGSQLGDIAWSAACATDRRSLLVEGALFNVGVALFDTIVDDQPYRLPAAAKCLAPGHLRRHLVDGERLPASADAGVELIVDLFRCFFDRLRARLPPSRCVRLADLLEQMYRCETDPTADALNAKILPTVFFGELVVHESGYAAAPLFEQLGRLVALLDDWQDLASDMVANAPNGFLGASTSQSKSRHFAMSLFRVFGGSLSQDQIGRALALALRDTVSLARAVGNLTEQKTVYFLQGLLGMGGDA